MERLAAPTIRSDAKKCTHPPCRPLAIFLRGGAEPQTLRNAAVQLYRVRLPCASWVHGICRV
eukprot:scaffold4233_cov27-Prasinocladus_malaysianus.AAC.1